MPAKGDLTDYRPHPAATILDQVISIRIKELERNVHVRAVVERHHQGETLLGQEAKGIHILRIRETPLNDSTVTPKRLSQEVRCARGIVRFHFERLPTGVDMVVL